MENQTPQQPLPPNPNEGNFTAVPPAPKRAHSWKITIAVMAIIVIGLFGWYYYKVSKQVNTPVQIPISKLQTNQLKPVNLEMSIVQVPDLQNAFFDLNSINFGGLNATTSDIANESDLNAEYAIIRGQSFDKEMANRLISGSQAGLVKYQKATEKQYFQVPDYSDPKKITLTPTLYPMNSWRAASRVYLIKAVALANEGDANGGLSMAFGSLKLAHNIQNSQGPLIQYLVGVAIKDESLKAIQTMLPLVKSEANLKKYHSQLDQYNENKKGLIDVFKVDYLHGMLSLDSTAKSRAEDIKKVKNDPQYDSEIKQVYALWADNSSAFNQEETKGYVTDHYTKLIRAVSQECTNLQKIEVPNFLPGDRSEYKNTANIVGKWLVTETLLDLSEVFQKRCQEDVLLNATKILFAIYGGHCDFPHKCLKLIKV